MDIIIYLGTLLVGFGLSLFWKPAYIMVNKLAKVYLWLVLLMAVSTWIFYFAGIKNAAVLQVMTYGLKWAGIIAHLTLGYLLSRLASDIKDILPGDGTFRSMLNTTIWALSISVGNTFIIATVGKSVNMSDMISFFKQSGYAVWFLYFIMAAETTGAIGVLLHFRLGTGIPATAGLALIMLGAIYTHWHNGDPFSDSYAAVSQLISASLLIYLFHLERKLKKRSAPMSPENLITS